MKIFFLASISLIIFCQMTFAQINATKGFAIYLLPGISKRVKISRLDLKNVKPTGTPVISENEILHYQKETHEFQIDYTATTRLRNLRSKILEKPFGVFVGDEAVYAGVFWSSALSLSIDGVIIELDDLSKDFTTLKLVPGYPSAEYFTGTDLRADSRIFKTLENAGKLYEELELVVKCKKITASGKRRQSFYFNFEIVTVAKGKYTEKEINLELFDGKLLPELDADSAWGAGDNVEFNPKTEIILEISKQVGREKPDWFLREYRKK